MRVLILPERLAQVIDDGPEIRPGGEGVLEPREQRRAVGALVDGGVPLGAARHDCRFRRPAAVEETRALPRSRSRAASSSPAPFASSSASWTSIISINSF
jgi:hypothetical protein